MVVVMGVVGYWCLFERDYFGMWVIWLFEKGYCDVSGYVVVVSEIIIKK